jgi:hypothetical protein
MFALYSLGNKNYPDQCIFDDLIKKTIVSPLRKIHVMILIRNSYSLKRSSNSSCALPAEPFLFMRDMGLGRF